MKIKLSQIIEAQQPLQRLAAEKYPANIAYRIQRNIRMLMTEALAYEKTREDLIKNKYGVPIVIDGQPSGGYRVPPERVTEFSAEVTSLLAEEVELDIRTLSLESVHEISPLDLMALEWMFEAPAEPVQEKPASTSARARHRSHAQRLS